MQSQQKEKIQFVDEFRKISTLEKLPVISSSLNDFFGEEADKDSNNKFMRLKKEPVIQYWPQQSQQECVLANCFVQESVNNARKEETAKYDNQENRITKELSQFKKMSQQNCHTKGVNKQFKFYYKNASPPKKIVKDSIGKEAYKLAALVPEAQSQAEENHPGFDVLKDKSHQNKYDFSKINKKRLGDTLEEAEKKVEVQREEDAQFLLAHKKYEKYKSIQTIMKLNEFQMVHKDFAYNLNYQENQTSGLDKFLLSKFIYRSTAKTTSFQMDIQYFRDIGLPSRDLEAYAQPPGKQRKQKKDPIEEEMKEDAQLLHLLTEKELNINKQNISFEDLANISMGRITSINAYLCIRSQKVTKAQFDQLLRRLDKYKKQQMEKDKKKQVVKIGTEDMENTETQDKQHPSIALSKNPTWQLINEIMELRKEAAGIEKKRKKNDLTIQESLFKKQLYNRMDILLKKLYGRVVQNPSKHPLNSIQEHLSEQNLQQILTPEGKNGKILWFVVDCLQEITLNAPKQDNIMNLLKKKSIVEPKLNFFKGTKLIKEDNIRAVQLYSFKEKPNQTNEVKPQRDKAGREKSKTPIKGDPNRKNTTPTAKKFAINSEKESKNTTVKRLWKV